MYETTSVDIASYVTLSFEQVLSARILEHNNHVVIAILTTPIFSASERIALKEQIRSDVAVKVDFDPSNVIVTFDMDVYRALGCDNPDKDRILNEAIERNC